ncbi:MerR family transcriptional regulator [Aquimarina hainanensis]|uniref:MerR family transcriptional regulator n=1 Tax=Aquimarina hainanensis TaxID=1578017 RepID=A0ABW5NC14_9FLAO
MEAIKKHFSIKDLENLSGIKAHTIRIWEKRYGLLSPLRTKSNIRYYDLESLQKLLNIVLLYNNGVKISKIAKLDFEEIAKEAEKVVNDQSDHSPVISAMKVSMLNFDQRLFFSTYDSLSKEKTFSEIFKEVFIPLLNEIGFLWQVDTITPSHEHFICNLIKQKIYIHSEALLKNTLSESIGSKTFVLYLPEKEIHELGLLYVNYELLAKGYHVIYLGQSVPIESLKDLVKFYDDITFVSYFTVAPVKDDIDQYLQEFLEEINCPLWILGQMVTHITPSKIKDNVRLFTSIKDIVTAI